jgi:hypothetical protein
MEYRWTMKLVSPKGEEFTMDNNFGGYASSVVEHSFVFPLFREFLSKDQEYNKFLLTVGASQALLNETFMQFHSYRLAWGNANPTDPHVAYPNGVDTNWTIYRCSNGNQNIILSGSLPDNWWNLEDGERQVLAEECLLDFE